MVASAGLSVTPNAVRAAVVELIGSSKVIIIVSPTEDAATRSGLTLSNGVVAVEAAEVAEVVSTPTATAVNV
jgi:hypothetical protein